VTKRFKFSPLRFSLVLALIGLFLYSATVQEIHYLFVHHEAEFDHQCANHIHSKSSHTECSICKFTLSSFVESFDQFEKAKTEFTADCNVYELHEALFSRSFSAIALRGPPALA
jgi:hypothetical protein